MGPLLLYKAGAYNLYSTIADGPYYESALTLDQLREVIRIDKGEHGLRDLPSRLERAHKTGCSSLISKSLKDCILANRAGPGETHMPFEEFVAKFLTLQPNEQPALE